LQDQGHELLERRPDLGIVPAASGDRGVSLEPRDDAPGEVNGCRIGLQVSEIPAPQTIG
jgi:hypothetical protein